MLLDKLVNNSVNVPFWDQWVYVDLFDKLRHGTLGLKDLWMQHNEHRILFPKLITLLFAQLTRWNLRAEVLLNFVTASLSFGLLLALAKRTFQTKWPPLLIFSALSAWLFFSPIQYINWLWGFQLVWFVLILSVLGTIWLLTQTTITKPLNLILAVATATIATYSLGNGAIIWLVGLIILLLRKVKRLQLLGWVSAASVVVASYLYHFKRPTTGLGLREIVTHGSELTGYVMAYLGRNVATTVQGAMVSGLVLMVALITALVFIYKKGKLERVLSWGGLALFILITAVLAGASRLSFGIEHSMSLSYTTSSALFIIAVIMIVLYALTLHWPLTRSGANRVVMIALLLGAAAWPATASFIHNYHKGTALLKDQGGHLKRVQTCLNTAQSANDDCLLLAFPDKQKVWQKIQTLRELKLGPFAPRP